MTDINEVIAKHKEWVLKKELQGLSIERDIWIAPKAMFSFPNPPDYLNDARLYMGLFEEMPNPILRRWNDKWLCIPESRKSMIIESVEIESDTIGTAICLSYICLHGLE